MYFELKNSKENLRLRWKTQHCLQRTGGWDWAGNFGYLVSAARMRAVGAPAWFCERRSRKDSEGRPRNSAFSCPTST